MPDPCVHEVARVADMDGHPVRVGVSGGMVTIGGPRPIRLGPDERNDFIRAYMDAERQAEEYGPPGCVCGRTIAACAEAGREASDA